MGWCTTFGRRDVLHTIFHQLFDFQTRFPKKANLIQQVQSPEITGNMAGKFKVSQKQVFKLPNPTLNTPEGLERVFMQKTTKNGC